MVKVKYNESILRAARGKKKKKKTSHIHRNPHKISTEFSAKKNDDKKRLQ